MTPSWHHVSALASSLAARSFKSWIVLVFTGSIQKMVKRPLLCGTSVQRTIFPFPEVAVWSKNNGGGGWAPQAPPLDPVLPSNSKIYEKGLRSNQEPIIYPGITKPRYSEPNVVSPLAFVISRFHSIMPSVRSWFVMMVSKLSGKRQYGPWAQRKIYSSTPWDKGGGGRPQKIFFRPFGPHFGLKMRGGRPPQGPPLDPPLALSSNCLQVTSLAFRYLPLL